jgi:hypothetical protein
MPTNRNQRTAQLIIALVAWAALILQFYLNIINRKADIPETIIRYFSYFTILTNLLVAVCFTSLLLNNNKARRFFNNSSVLTAVTVYIFIVGLIYNLILRFLWAPQGLQLLADNALHVVTPLLTLIYWFVYVSAADVSWRNTPRWMIYPFLYLILVMIRGSFSNFYPYFFIDAGTLGYSEAILNAVYVTLCFLAVSLLLVWLGKKKKV